MPGPEPAASSSPLVVALLGGQAPRALKLSAARGVLPLMRGELVKILVLLATDQDGEVRHEAESRLASLSEDEVLPLLSDPATAPEVLDYFAGGVTGGGVPATGPGPAARRESILSNPAASTRTLRRLAPLLTAPQIDQLLLNQTLLIATPDLLDMIGSNPAATPLQRSRVAEIRKHFLAPRPSVADDVTQPVALDPAAAPQAPAPSLDASTPATRAAPEPLDQPESAGGEGQQTAGEAEAVAVIDNVNQRILRMSTGDKIQLAMKGSREERGILIKDASKIVQEAVLDSPKLTDNEVESIAKMRSVGEDVLRIIAGHRDWMKNYTVIHALATNPKTPVGIAMTLLSRLNTRDIKIMANDKNVSEVIRRQARKVLEGREQGAGQRRN